METATVTALPQAAEAAAPQALSAFNNPRQAVAMAMQSGDLAMVAKFMDLQERYDANEARKAYVAAMAAFKLNPPEILKGKAVSFNDVSYKHATLADVCTAAIKGLAQVGISHSWDTKQEGGRVIVTCTLTHELGHRESTTLEAGLDNSGKKNSIQQLGSTITYLQRYTLKMITGLAEADDDDDGKGAADAPPVITEDQAANIEALITEIGINRQKFMEWIRADKIGDIPARAYATVIRELEARRAR